MEKTWNRSGQSYYRSAFMLIQEVKKKPKTSSKELHVSLVSMKSVKDKKDTEQKWHSWFITVARKNTKAQIKHNDF